MTLLICAVPQKMRSCTTRRWGQQGFCSQAGRVTYQLRFPAISGRLRAERRRSCGVRWIVPVCVGRQWFTVEPKVKGGAWRVLPCKPSRHWQRGFLSSRVCLSRWQRFSRSLLQLAVDVPPRGGMHFLGSVHWSLTNFTISDSGWDFHIM